MFPVDFPWSQSIDRQKQHCRVLKNKSCEIFSVRRETMKGTNTIRYLLLAASDSLGCSSRLPQFFQFEPDPLKKYWKNRLNCWLDHLNIWMAMIQTIHFSIQSSWNDPSWSHQGLRSNTWCTWGTPRKPGTCWCVARRASSTMRLIKSGWGCLNLSGSGVICSYCCYCHHYSFLQLLNCYKSIHDRDCDWLCNQLQLAQHDVWGHIFHKSGHSSSGHPQGSWLSRAPQCMPGTAVVFCSVSAEARPEKVVGVEPFGPSNDLRYADLWKQKVSHFVMIWSNPEAFLLYGMIVANVAQRYALVHILLIDA